MTTNSITWQEAMRTVERLSLSDQLRLMSELLTRLQTIAEVSDPIDLLELAGVGAEVWTQVDTDAYLNEERDSWKK